MHICVTTFFFFLFLLLKVDSVLFDYSSLPTMFVMLLTWGFYLIATIVSLLLVARFVILESENK